jgi:uncharacterized protein (TIGR03435 family)
MTMKRLDWRTRFGPSISLFMAAGILFSGPVALLAQDVTSAPAAPLGAAGKPLTFDVVSVRELESEPTPQSPVQNSPTADGYRLKGLPLMAVIQRAYIPSEGGLTFRPNQITGLPAWASYSIRYDIDAKVSEADLPKWNDPALQPAMLRAMLQAMLADRFNLVVHRETKEVPIYELTVARKSPKFKPSEATALADIRQSRWAPAGVKLPDQQLLPEVIASLIRMTGGNFRLLARLLTQIERVLRVNDLHLVSNAVVEAARESLVIGPG